MDENIHRRTLTFRTFQRRHHQMHRIGHRHYDDAGHARGQHRTRRRGNACRDLIGEPRFLQCREHALFQTGQIIPPFRFRMRRPQTPCRLCEGVTALLKPVAQGALKQVASVIRERAKGQVRIQGHTDAKGSDAYNERLSTRRADAVKAWLMSKEGLGRFTFATQGFGAKRPVAPSTKPDGSDDPEGRQKNRRVEIVVTK